MEIASRRFRPLPPLTAGCWLLRSGLTLDFSQMKIKQKCLPTQYKIHIASISSWQQSCLNCLFWKISWKKNRPRGQMWQTNIDLYLHYTVTKNRMYFFVENVSCFVIFTTWCSRAGSRSLQDEVPVYVKSYDGHLHSIRNFQNYLSNFCVHMNYKAGAPFVMQILHTEV